MDIGSADTAALDVDVDVVVVEPLGFELDVRSEYVPNKGSSSDVSDVLPASRSLAICFGQRP